MNNRLQKAEHDNIVDDLKSTGDKWSTELTAALHHAGFGTHWEKHSGSSTIQLGKLIVTKHDWPDTTYPIAFERKLVTKALSGKARDAAIKDGRGVLTRRLITRLEVYNPVGGLHVHISNFSDETVAKVVSYAKTTIEKKLEAIAYRGAVDQRADKAAKLYAEQMKDFILPDWVRARANVETDADLGTFRLLFSDHRTDWPLARLTIKQVRAVVDAIRAVTCDHKFVDSLSCLKCGWKPPVEPPAQPAGTIQVTQAHLMEFVMAVHNFKTALARFGSTGATRFEEMLNQKQAQLMNNLPYDKAADDKQWMDLTTKG